MQQGAFRLGTRKLLFGRLFCLFPICLMLLLFPQWFTDPRLQWGVSVWFVIRISFLISEQDTNIFDPISNMVCMVLYFPFVFVSRWLKNKWVPRVCPTPPLLFMVTFYNGSPWSSEFNSSKSSTALSAGTGARGRGKGLLSFVLSWEWWKKSWWKWTIYITFYTI